MEIHLARLENKGELVLRILPGTTPDHISWIFGLIGFDFLPANIDQINTKLIRDPDQVDQDIREFLFNSFKFIF